LKTVRTEQLQQPCHAWPYRQLMFV